jgi:hypothetical protein
MQVSYFKIASMLTDPPSPQLQPPGKGLPYLELVIARILVARKLRRSSPQDALHAFSRERSQVLSIVNGVSEDRASKRVLIARPRGLEDSSRYWSLYMTMEHVRIVNQSIIDTVSSLLAGIKPPIAPRTELVKPSENVGKSVIESFNSVCDEFERRFPPTQNLKTSVTLAHPWFGELHAEQWHFFGGFHMALHRKQMLKIVEELNKAS